MIGSYGRAGSDDIEHVNLSDAGQVKRLLSQLSDESEPGSVPALVLENENGHALAVAQVQGGAALVWLLSDVLSFHAVSTAIDADSTELFTYSYYGQETEVSSQDVVPIETAIQAVMAWFETGAPGVPYLRWEQG